VIERIQLLRNVGQFDSVSVAAQLPLKKLSLVYAENGRGKTTLAAILRSASNGDPILVNERQRVSSSHPPHIVLADNSGHSIVFRNGTWSRNPPNNVAVFDDRFVSENVCSGLEIGADHRQNLHELILGAQGVALNAALQKHVAAIEEHNRVLREKADAIPASVRGSLTVDAFCALKPQNNIEDAIQNAERALAAARAADTVRTQSPFDPVSLPEFDVAAIESLLRCDLPNLEAEAAMRVQTHLRSLGPGGENWVAEGVTKIQACSTGSEEACPFCAQDLRSSPLVSHYRGYFSAAYADLKKTIVDHAEAIKSVHGGDAPAAFERAIRIAVQRQKFWAEFTEVPHISFDTAGVARLWKDARERVLEELRAKWAAPLEPMELSQETREAISAFHRVKEGIAQIASEMEAANSRIAAVKEKAAASNVTTLEADLAKLRAMKERHSPAVAALCQDYLDEKYKKVETEKLRNVARKNLDAYRAAVFPVYETKINFYLEKFNVAFRVGSVNSVNIRSGSTCNYSFLINNTPISVANHNDGAPSFRNTLSAGDRNTLALAFFFASLDQDPNLAQKIVVIDDPMTSLDEHRSLTTIQEMRRLLSRVAQVIVLSHSKPFLCSLWHGADTANCAAIKIERDGTGSTFTSWDVHQDCITEHDRRHALISSYVERSAGQDDRAVAIALRPTLEAFMRVAYPAAFPPGTLLGQFIGVCQQRKGTPAQILAESDIVELRALLDYANQFHHDTNPAFQTVIISDQELKHFCERTLRFTRRA